ASLAPQDDGRPRRTGARPQRGPGSCPGQALGRDDTAHCGRSRPSRIVRPRPFSRTAPSPAPRMLDLLQGIRVVSRTHFLFVPRGIQALADLGAEVIAIEAPEGAWQRHWSSGDIWRDGQGMLHLCTNRNKRSVALDLKSPRGKDLALKLV